MKFCLTLEPAIKPLSITSLQVKIISASVAITIISNKDFPARIFATYNNTPSNNRHIYTSVLIGNMIVRNIFPSHRVFNSKIYALRGTCLQLNLLSSINEGFPASRRISSEITHAKTARSIKKRAMAVYIFSLFPAVATGALGAARSTGSIATFRQFAQAAFSVRILTVPLAEILPPN